MGNIIGEGFSSEIIEQIKTRQTIYGSVNRTEEQLSYLEARTGWCKLASSVDIVSIVRNIPAYGSSLATEFVLWGGVTNERNAFGRSYFQRGGVWDGQEYINVGTNPVYLNQPYNYYAYGMGGTDFGLKPMPGIKSASIKTETRGSLKTATIQIQANNREQFDIIDALYLRLGYTMLLEWGHSSYYKNNGTYVKENPYSLVDPFLTKSGNSIDEFQNTISLKRLESNGNYDALIGKVVNFKWNYTKEGTYDITLTLRSIGDVIESLKTNILLPGGALTTKTDSTQPPRFTDEYIEAFANTNEITKEFYKYQQKLKRKDVEENGMAVWRENNIVTYFKQSYNITSPFNDEYYVRFGTFLEFLESKIIPYINNNSKDKLVRIDTDTDTNIIYLESKQISADPRICMFKRSFIIYSPESVKTLYKAAAGIQLLTGEGLLTAATRYIYDGTTPSDVFKSIDESVFIEGRFDFIASASDFEIKKGENFYGKIMNAYFNIKWILTTMEGLKDNKGKISLYDLIKALCDGWNKATGNFNSLEPVLDSETNTLRIIDENPLPDKDEFLNAQKKSTALAFFDVYGYYLSDGKDGYKKGQYHSGFIKDLSFNTTVPPNLATMITVGATSQGYIVGQDATVLSRMNDGLIDRWKTTINQDSVSSGSASSSSLEDDYGGTFYVFNEYIRTIGSKNNLEKPGIDEEIIETMIENITQIYEYDQAKQTQSSSGSSSPTSGFLPFDLSLTMDGLSGMKVYQQYTIDSDFLPLNYPRSLNFLIKSITHDISSNQWNTTIESIAVPKTPKGTLQSSRSTTNTKISRSSNNVNKIPTETYVPNYIGPTSNLRKAIVDTATKYLNMGIKENPPVGAGSYGFNNAEFQRDIKTVGWYPGGGSEWCNWFTKLVWKQAYDQISATDPAVKNIKNNVFKNFNTRFINASITDCPITAYVPATFQQMAKIRFGPNNKIPGAERFVKGKTVIQNGDMVLYKKKKGGVAEGFDHIGIATSVNQEARTYISIDGNWGQKVSRYPVNMDKDDRKMLLVGIIRVVEPL